MQKKRKSHDYPSPIFRARDLDLSNLPKTDCHVHTSWTDGDASVMDVYSDAVTKGINTILYSEHSRKTSTNWFKDFVEEVRALPLSPCRAYVGTEVKVETNAGDIDTTVGISSNCDFITASVHRMIDHRDQTIQFTDTDPEQVIDLEYSLTWAVLENPQVDILGHIFGMSYKRFRKIPPNTMIRELIARAGQYNVAIEINSCYHPNALEMIRWCQEFDTLIAFGSDAHTLQEVGGIIRFLEKELANA